MKFTIMSLFFLFISFNLRASELANLQKISTLMLNNIDYGKQNCALNKTQSSAMLQAIRANTDQRFQKREDLGTDKVIKNFIKSCNKTCGCDFYQNLVERFSASNDYQSLFPLKRAKSIDCNKALLTACKSAEFKKLKTELKDFLPAAGI